LAACKAGGSLMPAGLADNLTRGELVDLVRFLSELGKLQAHHRQLNAEMLKIYELLNQSF